MCSESVGPLQLHNIILNKSIPQAIHILKYLYELYEASSILLSQYYLKVGILYKCHICKIALRGKKSKNNQMVLASKIVPFAK